MSDLLERLRAHVGTAHENETEAAKEIERLQQLASYQVAAHWRDKYEQLIADRRQHVDGVWREQEREIKRLTEENAKLRSAHRHCEHCGGSWLEDGVNTCCPCRIFTKRENEVKQLVDECQVANNLARNRKQRIDVLARRLELIAGLCEDEQAAEAAGGGEDE